MALFYPSQLGIVFFLNASTYIYLTNIINISWFLGICVFKNSFDVLFIFHCSLLILCMF